MNKNKHDAKINQDTLFGIIRIDDPDFNTKLVDLAKEYGVVVIKGVMTDDKCDAYIDKTVTDFEKIADFDRKDITTWTSQNLPRQVRPGMFHEVLCNTPNINKIRFDSNIIKIFRSFYSNIKSTKYTDTDLVISNDGFNLKPGMVGPYDNGMDWAHLDQTTDLDNPYKCIQGQMVLSNTTACFRASPKSHLLFREIIEENIDVVNSANSEFLKFKPEQYLMLKKRVEEIGGSWQIKIPADKGDFIIWTSATIHSAVLQTKPQKQTKIDKWIGWRFVVYVCYRPRDEFTNAQLHNKYNWFLENSVTNHWGLYAFPSRSNRSTKMADFSEKLRNFIKKPETVYDVKDMKPILTNDQQIMMGRSIDANVDENVDDDVDTGIDTGAFSDTTKNYNKINKKFTKKSKVIKTKKDT